MQKTLLLAGGLAIFFFVSCSSQKESEMKIVGGEELWSSTDKRALLSTVALYTRRMDGRSSSCTGTLIGPTHVVTAAHCVKGFQTIQVGLGLSFHHIQQVVPVKRFDYHPAWVETRPNGSHNPAYDIAVMSLSAPFQVPNQPVAVGRADSVFVGRTLLVAGYGLASQFDPQSISILRQVRVQVGTIRLSDKILEVKSNGRKGGCNGDSGGPAYIEENRALQVVGATTGPSTGLEHVPCDVGHGAYGLLTIQQGWMKCTFASHGNPLDSLVNDSSQSYCRR
jgi:secreted trypsin-like serine protease